MNYRYVWIIALCLALVMSVSAATTTVTSGDMATNLVDVFAEPTSWFFFNDETDAIDSALGTFVAGPASPPAGTGSVQITVSGTQRRNLATYQFAGTPLANITELKFSTYNPSAGNAGSASRSGYLHFNVDFNGGDTWQRRLVYVPSQNGAVVQDSWQEWDTINGGNALWTWSGYGSSGNQWPDGNTDAYRTWNDILSAFPGVRVRVSDPWLGVRVGEPYADGYTENLDAFVFGTAAGSTTFDFEPDAVDADGDGYASDVDCNDNDVAINPGAADAVCDGVDNNCDAVVDDGFVSAPTSCGVGVCAAVGATTCVAGVVGDSCVEGTPTAEVCDALDNDCDAAIDEDLDTDNDGVLGCMVDICLNTAPDTWTQATLGVNRLMWDGTKWVTKNPKGKLIIDATTTMSYTHGCSCDQILDSMSQTLDADFGGHYKFGCSKSIVQEWNSGVYYVGPTFIETVTVPAESATPVSSVATLETGKDYFLKASGTANAGDNIEFDAQYSFKNGSSTEWTDAVNTYEGLGTGLLDLFVDGADVEWGPYSATHMYQIPYAGTGAVASFVVNDAYYPGNTGVLSVDIIEDKWVDLW